MRKTITPVISVILLVLLTILISASAFFWISSLQGRLQELSGGRLETTSAACSRINIISAMGTGIYLQNTGCDTLESISLLINGELTDYTLDEPLDPGKSATITFTEGALPAGEAYTFTTATSNGQISSFYSSALETTGLAGYCEASLSATCGNRVCDRPCEAVSNCCRDCCVRSMMYEQPTYQLSYFNYMFNAPIGTDVIGNRTIYYTAPYGLYGWSLNWVSNEIFLFLYLEYNEEMNSNIAGFVYNGSWSSKQVITNSSDFEIDVSMSSPSSLGLVDILVQNCTVSVSEGCDLYYMNWSLNTSFSMPVRVTNYNTTSDVFMSNRIDSSRTDPNKKIILYGNNFVNYTFFNGSGWSEPETVEGFETQVDSLTMNEEGEVLFASSSGHDLAYYKNGSWYVYNNIYDGKIGVGSYENNFLVFTERPGGCDTRRFYDGSFFGDPIFFSNDSSIVIGPAMSRTKDGDLLGYVISSTRGIYVLEWNGNSAWSKQLNVTYCGIAGCEKYEACSSDCSTETWCSDGVDNDEDGFFDSADSDCT